MRRIICRWLDLFAERRPPHVVIGDPWNPYLLRWHLIPRNRWFNIYFHVFLRSDDDRALHDHPWWNCSWLLRGGYLEHLAGGKHVLRKPGDVVFRRGEAAHRIELQGLICATLFITGPHYREWGFHCPQGWRHWREFTAPHNSGEVGRGCE